MKVQFAYRISNGSGIIEKEFKDEKEYREFMDEFFKDDTYKLIGIKEL